jgi:hypothetical protein
MSILDFAHVVATLSLLHSFFLTFSSLGMQPLFLAANARVSKLAGQNQEAHPLL